MNIYVILDDFKKIEPNMSWDAWYDFEARYFVTLLNAPSKEPNELERQSRRQSVNINGIYWNPVGSADVSDKDLEFLHWKLRAKVFAQLEPEAAAENAAHPERYDLFCVYCEIRTSERSLLTCPVCEHDLVDFPLNDTDD